MVGPMVGLSMLAPTAPPMEPFNDFLDAAPPVISIGIVQTAGPQLVAEPSPEKEQDKQPESAKTLLHMAKYAGPRDQQNKKGRSGKTKKEQTKEQASPTNSFEADQKLIDATGSSEAKTDEEGDAWRKLISESWKVVK